MQYTCFYSLFSTFLIKTHYALYLINVGVHSFFSECPVTIMKWHRQWHQLGETDPDRILSKRKKKAQTSCKVTARDRKETGVLLLSPGPAARRWPARASLAHPDTNCTSGNRPTDLSASRWSAMTVILEKKKKKLSASAAEAETAFAKKLRFRPLQPQRGGQTQSPGKPSGMLRDQSAPDRASRYYSFPAWCWASWGAGCKCWLLHTVDYYCYYTER